MNINSMRKFIHKDGSRVTFIEIGSTNFKTPDESLFIHEVRETPDGVQTAKIHMAKDGTTAINLILGNSSWQYEHGK